MYLYKHGSSVTFHIEHENTVFRLHRGLRSNSTCTRGNYNNIQSNCKVLFLFTRGHPQSTYANKGVKGKRKKITVGDKAPYYFYQN